MAAMGAGSPPASCRWCANLAGGRQGRCAATGEEIRGSRASARRMCPWYAESRTDALTGAVWEPRAKGGRVSPGQTRMAI